MRECGPLLRKQRGHYEIIIAGLEARLKRWRDVGAGIVTNPITRPDNIEELCACDSEVGHLCELCDLVNQASRARALLELGC